MKNLPLILSAVLLVAVAALYYLHFSGPSASQPASATAPGDLKIAYINSDTILKYYDYFKVNSDRLEAKSKRLDQDLKSRAQGLQSEFESYQRNASTLTIGQARAVEEDLGKKRQNLQMYQESLSQEIMTDQDKLRGELYSRITKFLKTYSQQKGIQVVMKFDAASDLWYGESALDISKDVVNGLNEEYKQESTKTSRKDSTASKKK
ncbi:MAG: OmpH family outer membrane protein [Cyclobacteriaceae bacterium]|jgi:outer membrane protein|nr:outer membrane chaperone Skp [Cytophagales bacterium]HNP75935.1 OmpH family outer membrane protein [Cyclobacteriaceae bacterium]HQQ82172.1 OmpH family outer membrane protein [Cyclobacteriaceae bacterium]